MNHIRVYTYMTMCWFGGLAFFAFTAAGPQSVMSVSPIVAASVGVEEVCLNTTCHMHKIVEYVYTLYLNWCASSRQTPYVKKLTCFLSPLSPTPNITPVYTTIKVYTNPLLLNAHYLSFEHSYPLNNSLLYKNHYHNVYQSLNYLYNILSKRPI